MMAQPLRPLPEDLGSVARVTTICNSRVSDALLRKQQESTWCIDLYADKIHIHIK